MKNFDDFKATISHQELKNISNEIIAKLNNTESNLDIFEFERSYNLSLTMRLLEQYHKWLNN